MGYIKAIDKLIELKTQNKLNAIKKLNKTEDFSNLDKLIISPKTKERNKEIALTKEKNIYLYNIFIIKLNSSIYNETSMINLYDKLLNKKYVFEELNIYEQTLVLNQIIKRIGTGVTRADLTLLKEGSSFTSSFCSSSMALNSSVIVKG